MGLLSGIQDAANAVKGPKRKSVGGADQGQGGGSTQSGRTSEDRPASGDPDDTSVLDEEQGNVIHAMISQLRIGMDLQRISFPTFVLEPRSMLERITDFMSHPELVFGAEKLESPEDRFIKVMTYYLSGWHIKPKGVKKPYNPVLGEIFRCTYEYADGTKGYYVAEQVSHHPPISAYFYISPHNKIRMAGELRPKSKFLGNSVATIMEGENRVFLFDRPTDGEYVLELPNMYARGILFGSMVFELGDTTLCQCEATGMSCNVEFKTKGYFSGTYNNIQGKVKNGNSEVGALDGTWSNAFNYKESKSGEKRNLFDVKTQTKPVQKKVAPESEQEPYESRRLWSKLTTAIGNRDMDAAQAAKSEVEDEQREIAKDRETKGIQHKQRFFEQRDGLWQAKIQMLQNPDEMCAALEKWIWSPPPTS